jgi:hypothetical protein
MRRSPQEGDKVGVLETMSEIDRRWFADRQIRLNRATEKSAPLFAPHRRRVTDLALRAEGGAAAVLGAGNCNDVDLPALAARFDEAHLVDLDGEALRSAILRQPEEVRAKLVPHGGVDLSGLLDLLAGWDRGAPSPAAIDAAVRAAAGGAAIPAGELGLCLSACLLTQMILSIVDRLGAAHPRAADLARALRMGHLRALARSLRPGGLGVVVSDMVSSDTVPDLAATPPAALASRMEALVRAGNFFTGANPYALVNALTTEPALAPFARDVALSAPWIWQIAERRSYLVFAVRFRRTARAAP